MEDPDELVACPFDPVHKLQRKRMPYHIIKCRKNQPQKHFRVCPFNHRHIVHHTELESHLSTCPDQGIVERELTHRKNLCTGVIPLQKGYTNVPVSSFAIPDSVEDWDDSNVTVGIGPYNNTYSGTGCDSSSPSNSGRQQEDLGPGRGQAAPVCPRLPMTIGPMSEVFQVATSKLTDPDHTPRAKAGKTLPDPAPSIRARGRGRGGVNYMPHAEIRPHRMEDHVPMGVEVGVGSGQKVMHGRGTMLLQATKTMEVGRRAEPEERQVQETSPGEGRNDEKTREQEMRKVEQERKKRGRKLKKMMRQIMELEEKQSAGLPLDSDQLDKISRKEDVQRSLQQFDHDD